MPSTYATFTTPEGKTVRTTLFIPYKTAQRLQGFKQIGKNLFVVAPANTALDVGGLMQILQDNKQATVGEILPTLHKQSKAQMRLATDKELAAYHKLKASLANRALANHVRTVKWQATKRRKEIKAATKVLDKYGIEYDKDGARIAGE